MNQSVNFLMSGDAHAPYLVVALRSLRQHYWGKVVVWAYPESLVTIQQISLDSDLSIIVKEWQPVYRGKNGQFYNKQFMMSQLTDPFNLYLDADVMVAGPLDPLFAMVRSSGFVATQFNTWKSNEGVVRKRILNLADKVNDSWKSCVKVASEESLPSVNGGVFGCTPRSTALSMWKGLTEQVLDTFIADEVALHLIVADYQERGSNFFKVAEGGMWNCSPKYQPASLKDTDVKIWHFHGDSNVRPQKSAKGYELWWKAFEECRAANAGKINDWLLGVLHQNRFLKELVDASR